MRGDPYGAAAGDGFLRDLHGGVQRESQARQARTQASQVHKTVELFPASRVLDKKRESFFILLAQERDLRTVLLFLCLLCYERMLRISTKSLAFQRSWIALQMVTGMFIFRKRFLEMIQDSGQYNYLESSQLYHNIEI